MLKKEPPAPTEYGWVSPGVGLDVLQKNLLLIPGFKLQIVQPVA
jgi:hypothetical protein